MLQIDKTANAAPNEIIAKGVSFEDYLERFAGMHCELVEGNVIKLSPATLQHNRIVSYLYMFFSAFFELRPIGKVISQHFTQRLPGIEAKREPDILIVLNTNPHTLYETYLDGPADLCIEVVSEDSIERDRGTKFVEYQKGGVPEYWIVDPIARESLFYRLNEGDVYMPQSINAEGMYYSPALPGLVLNTSILWQQQMPGPIAIGQAVEAMLKS